LGRVETLKNKMHQAWWRPPVIPVLGRLRQEDQRFQDNLGYVRSETRTLKKKGNKFKDNNPNETLVFFQLPGTMVASSRSALLRKMSLSPPGGLGLALLGSLLH
jgi:hypothetical protein